jgi:hypothetical protein
MDVTEQLTKLGQALDMVLNPGQLHHDALYITANAIKKIEYLRGCFGAFERGARPMKNFWGQLRERDRSSRYLQAKAGTRAAEQHARTSHGPRQPATAASSLGCHE